MPRRRGGFQKKIDYTRWVGGQVNAFALGAGTSGQIFASSVADRAETLLRTRGKVVCWVVGPEAPPVSADIGMGLIVVPSGTGATVTSSPIADENAPWLWYTRFTIGYEEMVTDVIDIPGLSIFREVVDSKAMRIIRPDREIQFVVENTTVSGALSVNISFNARMLFGQ